MYKKDKKDGTEALIKSRKSREEERGNIKIITRRHDEISTQNMTSGPKSGTKTAVRDNKAEST